MLLSSYIRKCLFQYVTNTLAADCYRSFATTLYLTGLFVAPTVPSWSFSKFWSLSPASNLNFCTIETRKIKTSIWPSCSPRQRRAPTENGMTYFDLRNFPFSSRCRSGLNFCGSLKRLGSLWTAQIFEMI